MEEKKDQELEVKQEEPEVKEEPTTTQESEKKAPEGGEEKIELKYGCVVGKSRDGQIVLIPLSPDSGQVDREVTTSEMLSLVVEATLFNLAEVMSTQAAMKTLSFMEQLRQQAQEELKNRAGIITPDQIQQQMGGGGQGGVR